MPTLHPEAPRRPRQIPTSSGDPVMRLLTAALDPETTAAELRALNDAFEGKGGQTMQSIPGMGRN